jgi:hypothetical protein
MQTIDLTGIHIEGHLKIFDPTNDEVFVNKRNAIHYENMSIALARSIADRGQGFIYEMSFGNGGTSINDTGIITYSTPNSSGSNASLYNQTFTKIIDDQQKTNLDPTRNYIETRHETGKHYTDVFITCLLDYTEPAGQGAYDNTTDVSNAFIFDELGLKAYSLDGNNLLLTHVIFHPIQKSLNRLIQIDYTVRIQSLTSVVGVQ